MKNKIVPIALFILVLLIAIGIRMCRQHKTMIVEHIYDKMERSIDK